MPDSPRRVRTRNSSWTATGKKLAEIIEQIRDLDEELGLGRARRDVASSRHQR